MKVAEIMSKKTTEILTQPQAAALLGVTARRLRQRDGEDNPPPKTDAGQYPCAQYGDWLRAEFKRGLGVTSDGTVYDYDAERSRLTHHQANIAALDEEVKRGRLIPVEEVRQYWQGLLASARARLIGLPVRLASSCSGRGSTELETEARRIVYESMDELASGNDGVPPRD